MGASSRLRMYQYIDKLAGQNYVFDIKPLVGDWYLERLYEKNTFNTGKVLMAYFRRLMELLRVRQYDLLWIEKELFPRMPAWIESLISVFGVKYVVDYDDPVFLQYQQSLTKNKIGKVMRCADTVVAGNRFIAQYARSCGQENVEIIPTVVDMERYQNTAKLPQRGSFTVGWIGTPGTVKYLRLLQEVFQSFARERTFSLCVIGAYIEIEGVDVVCKPWDEESEVKNIQQFDVGIMPLADTPWEQGKCGYKLIQYMACGVPVIASPVGVNREIVTNGDNGLLASDAGQWLKALRRFCDDTKLAKAMGVKARETVRACYSVQSNIDKLRFVLSSAARISRREK